MGCFANGTFLNQKLETPNISESDIQAFLASRKTVQCDNFNATLSIEACARNYLSAIQFSSSASTEINSSYRKPCLGCKIGEKNAAAIKKVKTKTCKQCGRDLTVTHEARNRTGICYSCRGNKGKQAAGNKRSALREIAEA